MSESDGERGGEKENRWRGGKRGREEEKRKERGGGRESYRKRRRERGDDISSDPHSLSENEAETEHSSDTDSDEDWSDSSARMDTDGDNCSHVRNCKTGLNNGDASETAREAERNQHKCCYLCTKRSKMHSGERTYSCSVCKKSFASLAVLKTHKRTHAGEKPYSCSACKKSFAHRTALRSHVRTHAREKPSGATKKRLVLYSIDLKTPKNKKDKPYSCPVCKTLHLYLPHIAQSVNSWWSEGPICQNGSFCQSAPEQL
ncbi:hypothetical protein WMY93_007423 [Mugilogobius chulae]|uniref:C2H2-type domain-containing protein n=1 Tax=Mugilogobius chulae TaxID=88201 RepID=A0AAW0PCW6_9GOBI